MRTIILLFPSSAVAFVCPPLPVAGARPLLLSTPKPAMGGWLDELADNFLGAPPVAGLGDGMAASFASEDTAAVALEEAAAAEDFDGRMLRDLIVQKWGKEYDCEFTVTDYLGKSSVYLNVFPWSSDAEPWRHDDDTAYLEHLQAVCEQLITWKRVAAVRRQITETDKEPRVRIPLKTVPLRLDLPNELARAIDQGRGGTRISMSMSPSLRSSTRAMLLMMSDVDDNNGGNSGNGDLLIGIAGVAAQPIVWVSLYSVATTGGGLPAGPFGVLGLLEGLSYLAIVGFVAAAIVSKVTTGSGLRAGPGGLLGLAEGLSFLSVAAGLAVLVYTATGTIGCVPNALPILDYSDFVTVCH